jgi:hypothetical protein
MNEPRRLPNQLQVVKSTEAGEVLEEVAPLSEIDRRIAYFKSHLLRGSQLLEMKPQSWLVPNWLPSDAVVAVYAAPGVGKSFYALTLSLEIARGGSWIGTPLEKQRVLYVAAEKATTLRDRAEAWCLFHGEEFPQEFLMEPPPTPPQLNRPIDVEALCRLIKEEQARFVVLDTYAMMLQGVEENSSKESGAVIDALSQLRQATNGGTVLIVHHSGKDSSKGLRGSSALLAAVDLTIEISSNGVGRLQANVRKSNAGTEPMAEHYTLNSFNLGNHDEEERMSAVLIGTGAPAANPELEAQLLEILAQSPHEAMTATEMRNELNEYCPKPLSRSSFERQALNPLIKAGRIVKQGKTKSTKYLLALQE